MESESYIEALGSIVIYDSEGDVSGQFGALLLKDNYVLTFSNATFAIDSKKASLFFRDYLGVEHLITFFCKAKTIDDDDDDNSNKKNKKKKKDEGEDYKSESSFLFFRVKDSKSIKLPGLAVAVLEKKPLDHGFLLQYNHVFFQIEDAFSYELASDFAKATISYLPGFVIQTEGKDSPIVVGVLRERGFIFERLMLYEFPENIIRYS